MIRLPARVYPILDSAFLPRSDRAQFLQRLGASLSQAGVTLLEYRNKTGTESEFLADAEVLRSAMPAGQVKLILDDRADLVERVGFDGVHVDAGDVSPAKPGASWGRTGSWEPSAAATRMCPGFSANPRTTSPSGRYFLPRPSKPTSSRSGSKGCAGCA